MEYPQYEEQIEPQSEQFEPQSEQFSDYPTYEGNEAVQYPEYVEELQYTEYDFNGGEVETSQKQSEQQFIDISDLQQQQQQPVEQFFGQFSAQQVFPQTVSNARRPPPPPQSSSQTVEAVITGKSFHLQLL